MPEGSKHSQPPQVEPPSEPPGISDERRPSVIDSALRILLPVGRPDGSAGAAAAVHWLVPGGLLIGLIYVGLYRAGWRTFGEVGGVRLLPALVVWLADVGLLGLLMVASAARTVDRWPSPDAASDELRERPLALAGALALAILVVMKLALWTAIPEGIAGWPTNWRRYFNFMYPWPVYRPLILAPIWGRWALILAAGVGRAAKGQPPRDWLSRSPSLGATLGWFAVAMVLTAIYCGRHGNLMIGCIISLIVLGVTFASTVVTARRFGGHTRFTVYAAGYVAEAAFLLSYLALAQHIYRY